jgi:2-C-methyl-D-erythritol 4-phosphate cytidylyltransferase
MSSSGGDRGAAAVVVAGGSGRRLGGGRRKQFLAVAGEPVLLRAVRPFLVHPRIEQVVVVLPPDDLARPLDWLRQIDVELTAGGPQRGDSVLAGLRRVRPDVATVLIHDGARPFPSSALIDRVLDACGDATGAVPGLVPVDTVKVVDGTGWITGTPERASLRQVQTPQGFPRAALLEAYEHAAAEGAVATDDAAVFERWGGSVRVVDGESTNLKVTVPADLALAGALAEWLSRPATGDPA